jgi:FtsH-binding integral membrane protein
LSAFIYAFSIFAVFSVFAMITVRRTQIFVYSAISCLALSLINIFVWNLAVSSIIGLVIGILYVILDTQIIVQKTELGVYDTFTDAKQLLIDLFKIFIEIFKLLASEKKKKNKD